ncbi:SidA/IucD/PvdA family monooxygenase [Kocuria rhizophila]|nr:SidA/IucD/PvdA family monooxygenase [Kocuria rhizophila]
MTMADPTSRFSFLQRGQGDERVLVLRAGVLCRCGGTTTPDRRWAAERVRGCGPGPPGHGGHPAGRQGPWRVGGRRARRAPRVVDPSPRGGHRHGPQLPAAQLSEVSALTVHAGEYLARREDLVGREHVSVVGWGQSAAEVFLDLPTTPGGPAVDWDHALAALLPDGVLQSSPWS